MVGGTSAFLSVSGSPEPTLVRGWRLWDSCIGLSRFVTSKSANDLGGEEDDIHIKRIRMVFANGYEGKRNFMPQWKPF